MINALCLLQTVPTTSSFSAFLNDPTVHPPPHSYASQLDLRLQVLQLARLLLDGLLPLPPLLVAAQEVHILSRRHRVREHLHLLLRQLALRSSK